MTLDDETAERIVREAVEKNEVWSGRYTELVRAGYAYRDAEVEELRAEVRRAKEATREAHWLWDQASEAAEAFNSTLAKVREYIAEHTFRDSWNVPAVYVKRLLAILDESPTEREALCDTEHPITGRLCSLPEGHEPGHICDRETPAASETFLWDRLFPWLDNLATEHSLTAERVLTELEGALRPDVLAKYRATFGDALAEAHGEVVPDDRA